MTGQTGTCKRQLACDLASLLATQNGISSALKDEPAKSFVRVYQIEDYLPHSLRSFLEDYNAQYRETAWDHALTKIYDQIRDEKPKYAFLLLHYFYFRNGRIFSAVNWDKLTPFHPSIVFTLIDDIFDIWQRVRNQEHDYPTGSVLSLQDILQWRNVEIAGSRQLASNLYVNPKSFSVDLKSPPWNTLPSEACCFFGGPIPHLVLAVKHPLRTFLQLIDNTHFSRVYASHPIGDVRNNKDHIQEINSFRSGLANEFIVFDPLTIDEYRTSNEKIWKEARHNTELFPTRWEVSLKPPLGPPAVPHTPLIGNPFLKHDSSDPLSESEIVRLKDLVEESLIERDLLMVGQSQFLCAYRPYFRGRTSLVGGMAEEMRFAWKNHIPVGIYHPITDYTEISDKNFFEDKAYKRSLAVVPAKGQSEGIDHLYAHIKRHFQNTIDKIP